MGFSHIGLPVGKHYKEMRDFYLAILEPLGYKIVREGEGPQQYCGFGIPGAGPDFWLGGGATENGLEKYDGELTKRVAPFHVAFDAKDREHVKTWYEHAM
jgi:catechol 2,3-dioxygenase-like lactoylglutathione lyase family enzyme